MCGLAGFIGNKHNNHECLSILTSMTDAIEHRGPDDHGLWSNNSSSLYLGHRRLSIVDLSKYGHQPMISHNKRYVITFNGEIYNHLSLLKLLRINNPSIKLKGHSDTEILLCCIETWGVEKTLKESIGMFAFALFDNQENALYLVRDRMGEKPLYYGIQNGVFMFASELKSLKKHPSFNAEIDRNSLALQLKLNYVPAPFSIYKDIKKIKPGEFLRLDLNKKYLSMSDLNPPISYWSLEELALNSKYNKFTGSNLDAINELESLLIQSVNEQMKADVPFGAFLSGGIDSSLIVSLMQSQSRKPIETFSIGFSEGGYNEADYAKEIAKYLGTNHNELYVSSSDAMNVIPKLPFLYDEPFSDSSQIPTYLVSEMTKNSVSVALSGDAGDELFGGYNRYLWTKSIWSKIKIMPIPVRKFIEWGMVSIKPRIWNKILQNIISLPLPGDKIHKLASILSARNPEELYGYIISHWYHSDKLVIGSDLDLNETNTRFLGLETIEQDMMYLDSKNYLPDDILVKVDRASMGVSLETRIPFLDYRIVEFANSLPLSMKINNGQGKLILRQLLDKFIPNELIDRPKMGFGVPIDSWLRGPLIDWAESLLDESRLKNEGYFHPKDIRNKWQEHKTGERNWQYHIWDILMFQSWLEQQ